MSSPVNHRVQLPRRLQQRRGSDLGYLSTTSSWSQEEFPELHRALGGNSPNGSPQSGGKKQSSGSSSPSAGKTKHESGKKSTRDRGNSNSVANQSRSRSGKGKSNDSDSLSPKRGTRPSFQRSSSSAVLEHGKLKHESIAGSMMVHRFNKDGSERSLGSNVQSPRDDKSDKGPSQGGVSKQKHKKSSPQREQSTPKSDKLPQISPENSRKKLTLQRKAYSYHSNKRLDHTDRAPRQSFDNSALTKKAKANLIFGKQASLHTTLMSVDSDESSFYSDTSDDEEDSASVSQEASEETKIVEWGGLVRSVSKQDLLNQIELTPEQKREKEIRRYENFHIHRSNRKSVLSPKQRDLLSNVQGQVLFHTTEFDQDGFPQVSMPSILDGSMTMTSASHTGGSTKNTISSNPYHQPLSASLNTVSTREVTIQTPRSSSRKDKSNADGEASPQRDPMRFRNAASATVGKPMLRRTIREYAKHKVKHFLTAFQVRVLFEDRQVWVVVPDVLEVLQIDRDSAELLREIPDNEKRIRRIHAAQGLIQVTAVNPDGVFRLVLRSKRALAEEFHSWVLNLDYENDDNDALEYERKELYQEDLIFHKKPSDPKTPRDFREEKKAALGGLTMEAGSNHGWESLGRNHTVNIFRRKGLLPAGFLCVKAKSIVRCSVSEFSSVVWDLNNRREWDGMFVNGDIVEEMPEDNIEVAKVLYRTPYPFSPNPIKTRDFSLLRTYEIDPKDGTIVIAEQSILHKMIPSSQELLKRYKEERHKKKEEVKSKRQAVKQDHQRKREAKQTKGFENLDAKLYGDTPLKFSDIAGLPFKLKNVPWLLNRDHEEAGSDEEDKDKRQAGGKEVDEPEDGERSDDDHSHDEGEFGEGNGEHMGEDGEGNEDDLVNYGGTGLFADFGEELHRLETLRTFKHHKHQEKKGKTSKKHKHNKEGRKRFADIKSKIDTGKKQKGPHTKKINLTAMKQKSERHSYLLDLERVVRGEMYSSGFVIRPTEKKNVCEVTYVVQLNLKGDKAITSMNKSGLAEPYAVPYFVRKMFEETRPLLIRDIENFCRRKRIEEQREIRKQRDEHQLVTMENFGEVVQEDEELGFG